MTGFPIKPGSAAYASLSTDLDQQVGRDLPSVDAINHILQVAVSGGMQLVLIRC